MAWWKEIGGDEIGDQAASVVEIGLDEIVTELNRGTQEFSLNMNELLQALAESLCSTKHLMEERNIFGIEAILKNSQPQRYICHPSNGDSTLRFAMNDMLDKIVKCYLNYLARAPRASEICAVFAFVLRYKPERFCQVEGRWILKRLRPIFRL